MRKLPDPLKQGESPLDLPRHTHYLGRRMGFDTLGLSAAVLEAIEESGYTTPTPIQAQAIPIILEGKDVIGASQTGTGKTAAFALPTLSKIEKLGKPQILVLEPTRELAHQVAEQFEKYGKHTGLKVALLYGGVGLGTQAEQLAAGADIVVATPGRLVDHFYRTSMRFGAIKVLILDEVDRMLDMGFLPQVRKIVNLCPWEGRQTLFFSATMPPAIQTFAQWCLTEPQSIEIARASIPTTVTHAFYPVAMDQRDDILLELLKQTDYHSVMIFTRTRKEADQLTQLIKTTGQEKVAAMHSDISQVDRMKALAGFKAGEYEILVATDVAARGIDISGVSHVINYRVPENAEDYVHRIGRTGRAEAEGDAFTILTADELDYAKSVEIFIDQKIPRRKLDDFEYIYTALLDTSPGKPIRKKKTGGGKKRR
jgi:ATP-dependent RNA helicase RhlE